MLVEVGFCVALLGCEVEMGEVVGSKNEGKGLGVSIEVFKVNGLKVLIAKKEVTPSPAKIKNIIIGANPLLLIILLYINNIDIKDKHCQ